MNKLWMSVSVAVAAPVLLASPAFAQKGKGKGHSVLPAPRDVLPFGKGKDDLVRPFEQPNTGNPLPPSIRDQLPPGLLDKAADQPGVANHLRKLGDDKPSAD